MITMESARLGSRMIGFGSLLELNHSKSTINHHFNQLYPTFKDITLYNNADYDEDSTLISTQVIIQSNGSVTWLSTSIYRSTCSINIEYFPFDTQNCSLSFGICQACLLKLNYFTFVFKSKLDLRW